MYLFTISYGTYALDQRRGDGWFSGWFIMSSSSVRGIQMPHFEVHDARIASALNRIIHNSHFKKKDQSGGTKGPKRGPFPSWKTDCLPDLRVLTGHWSQRFCRELCRPFSLMVFEMTIFRNSIQRGTEFYYQWRKIPPDDILWKDCTNWETQDRIGIVQPGDSSEENRTWLSQIDYDGRSIEQDLRK